MADFWEDFNAWWDRPVGYNTPWAGGTLAMESPGTSTYYPYDLETYDPYTFTQDTPIEEIYAANPNIASLWDTVYGTNAWGGDTPNTANPYASLIDIPYVYPQSSSTSTSSSVSHTGLSPQLQNKLMEYLTTLQPAAQHYINALDRLSSPGTFINQVRPIMESTAGNIIRNKARKGILSSSLTENALADAMATIPNTYLSQLLNIANTANAGLGSFASGLSTGVTTDTTSLGSSQSQTTDELAFWQFLTDFLNSEAML